MFRRLFSSRRIVSAGFLLLVVGAICSISGYAQNSDTAKRGRKYKAPPPTARVEITVVRATTGKPIENASVIFHPLEDGHNAGNMELKTNDEGKASIDLLEIGSDVRLQIIAHGFQTFGEDYKIDKDTMAIEVKMKRPVEQYSIYKKSEGKPSASDKPADKPDAAPKATPQGEQSDKQKDTPSDAPKDESKPQDSAQPK
jgi:hypothetical protein